jgi:redox-sensitive bicupin YhaK (pirin superfamily)
MAGNEVPPRVLRVPSSSIDLEDVSGRVLFPTPMQGPWLPFQRFADTITRGSGDDPEGHTHLGEEVLNYVVAGRVDYEDNTGHRSVLEAGSFELLTAREETRHKLTGQAGARGTRWLSVVVRCRPTPEGPSHRFQVVTRLTAIQSGDATVGRLLVGPDAPAESGAELECTDIEFRREGNCTYPVGAGRRVVAYVYEGSGSIEGQLIDSGIGALMENTRRFSIQARAGTRVLLASAPRMIL